MLWKQAEQDNKWPSCHFDEKKQNTFVLDKEINAFICCLELVKKF